MRHTAAAIALAVLWAFFAVANVETWRTAHHPTGLPVAAFEFVCGYLFLVRRPASGGRAPLGAWAAGFAGTAIPLFLRPGNTYSGAFGDAMLGVQVASALVAFACLVALGRSFGIVAANRGVRTSGAYRIVRHPVYTSYTCLMLGYLGENPTWRNVAVVVAGTAAQLARIHHEERHLGQDPAYRAYALHVRWRLLPHVY